MRQCFQEGNEEKSLLCEREFNVRIHAPKMTAIPTLFALKRTRRRRGCFFVLVFIVCAAAFFVSTPVSADVSVTDPGEDSDDFGANSIQQQEQQTRGRRRRRVTSTRDDENEEDDFAAVSSSSVSSNHESSSSSKSSKMKAVLNVLLERYRSRHGHKRHRRRRRAFDERGGEKTRVSYFTFEQRKGKRRRCGRTRF